MTKVLVIGVSGMLGSSAYDLLTSSEDFEVIGTARTAVGLDSFKRGSRARIVGGIDVTDNDRLIRLFAEHRPDVVINCVGVIKQLEAAKDSLMSIAINALLPHRLADLCAISGARLVQISTDCVFSGRQGNYRETDFPDAYDLYGRTKLLGEVDYPHAVTLRTSIIGHEIGSSLSLIDWFLSQSTPQVRGFRKAIYTGLPTVELTRLIRDVVIPRPELRGLWHVSSAPINKYDLLCLVAKVYGKNIEIIPDDDVEIDRSLDGSRFRDVTGYVAPPWPDLIAQMRSSRLPATQSA